MGTRVGQHSDRCFDLIVDPRVDPRVDFLEVVERKGIGHPDTIADGIAELASIRYSEYCLNQFGAVLHHNLDKVAVFGGHARFSWSSGEYDKPVRIAFGGRASTSLGSTSIPVKEILEAAALEYMEMALPGFNRMHLEFRHFTSDSSKFPHWFKPRTLEDLPELREVRANDTALLRGFAPFSLAERIVFYIEAVVSEQSWTGTDVKVLVVRSGNSWTITACVPALVGSFDTASTYRDAVAFLRDDIHHQLVSVTGQELELAVNARSGAPNADAPAYEGYVTLSGSALDFGEDGQVGRGNSRMGLSATGRGVGFEVLFGKNPMYHVGKVTAILVDSIAEAVSALGCNCVCSITTRIGYPINDFATMAVATDDAVDGREVDVIVAELTSKTDWTPELITGRRYVPGIRHVPLADPLA